jgi:hypothetical protein
MLKYALAQGRVGNEKLALETDGGFLLGNVSHGRTLARGRRAVKAEGGVREGKCELREGRRVKVGVAGSGEGAAFLEMRSGAGQLESARVR